MLAVLAAGSPIKKVMAVLEAGHDAPAGVQHWFYLQCSYLRLMSLLAC
jgi:hypothetical protein